MTEDWLIRPKAIFLFIGLFHIFAAKDSVFALFSGMKAASASINVNYRNLKRH
jgi:hypothetical protein